MLSSMGEDQSQTLLPPRAVSQDPAHRTRWTTARFIPGTGPFSFSKHKKPPGGGPYFG